MSSDVAAERTDGSADNIEEVDDDSAELTARLEVLREEKRRLRDEYKRARRSQYQRSAQTLVVVGVLTLGAGLLFTNAQTVLFALGGTGVFLGVLTYFLTPERFITASVGEEVYASLANNQSQLTAELGLADERVYVTPDTGQLDDTRLFVPQHENYEVPEGGLDELFVVGDSERARGVALRPTGVGLYTEFEQAATGDPTSDAETLATGLSDALVEQFELADSAQVDSDADSGRVSVRVSGSALGRVDRFDHPVVSVFGVGLASVVDGPVRVEVTVADEAGAEFVVTCHWTPEQEPPDESP